MAATPGNPFVLTLITRDPALAASADAAGVDRVGVDIERLNKLNRQGHVANARISDHELRDFEALTPVLHNAAVFARLNTLHNGSKGEVEEAIARRAAVLMLPFFTTAHEVDQFVRLVDGRTRVVLLLETASAVARLHEILAVPGIDEVIVGLNDLHLSMGLANHFELVASDVLTMLSDRVRERGLAFGFGGVARPDDDSLPVPADLVLAQHARLKSTSSWISRSFFNSLPPQFDFAAEIARLRRRLAYWAAQPSSELLRQRDRLRSHLKSLANP